MEYKVAKFPIAANSKAHAIQQTEGFVKILSSPADGKILGVHIISSTAEEAINEIAVIMAKNGTVKDLARMSHTHPTIAESIKEAAAITYDKSVHLRPESK